MIKKECEKMPDETSQKTKFAVMVFVLIVFAIIIAVETYLITKASC